MPDLKRYREKRDPNRTPEPFGDDAIARKLPPSAQRIFVVQQHAARALHWDLRLEIDGVLASWAVPRGPTLDPSEKRLAVRTEDHPMEYASFEGLIPEGNYGAGAMIVWDRGSYHTVDGVAPGEGLAKGKLDLSLRGHKLRGRFALVQTKQAGGKNWLLLRKGSPPPEDEEELVDALPRSVFSGLRVEELRDGVSLGPELEAAALAAGARRARLEPRKLRPMLARTGEAPFDREGWIFELKYDGMRVLAARDGDEVGLATRTGRDATAGYPEITAALAAMPVERFILDGELVAPDEAGHGSFERLQRRFSQTDRFAVARAQVEVPVTLQAFDLLAVGDCDIRRLPLLERKALLERLVPRRGTVCFTDHVETRGEALFDVAREHDLEGIMAKRGDSTYETRRRSLSWLKIKVPRTTRALVVGWQPGRGSRRSLGSLVLAWVRDGELVYAGNVGSGLSQERIDTLLPRLEASETDVPSFTVPEGALPRATRFASPGLGVDVRYTEVTSAGLLRHPVLAGLVEDASPEQCTAPIDREAAVEAAPTAEAPEAELQITRRDKVFWPDDGYTKGDLLDYYQAAWPWMERYLRDRPVVLTRYPDGIEGKHFFQQNAPDWTPAWARHERIDSTDFFLCNDERTLLHVINSGAIPLHVWSARVPRVDHPDWLVLDLDPKDAPFEDVIRVARHIHRLLDELSTPNFAKTSGQAGLHVMVPLGGKLSHDHCKALAEVLARVVAAELPEIATITRPVAARGDRVYVDYLQNGRGKLIAAPFSVRPRPGAPVSTPLTWNQVTTRLDPGRWTIETTLRQMEKKGDPLRGLLEQETDVDALLEQLLARLDAA